MASRLIVVLKYVGKLALLSIFKVSRLLTVKSLSVNDLTGSKFCVDSPSCLCWLTYVAQKVGSIYFLFTVSLIIRSEVKFYGAGNLDMRILLEKKIFPEPSMRTACMRKNFSTIRNIFMNRICLHIYMAYTMAMLIRIMFDLNLVLRFDNFNLSRSPEGNAY